MEWPQFLFEEHCHSQATPLLLLYKGGLSQAALVDLGNILRNKLGFDGKAKKVFSIFIELTQNIQRYSAERFVEQGDGKEAGGGVVAVSDFPDEYVVSAGNIIAGTVVGALREHCEHIATLAPEDLRAFYRQRLRSAPPPGSKGGGLGLIDIAIKTDTKVQFDLQPVDTNHYFFTINAFIKKG